jgi:hypothetical protein
MVKERKARKKRPSCEGAHLIGYRSHCEILNHVGQHFVGGKAKMSR